MSSQKQEIVRRLAAPDIRNRKGGEPIVMLTAYTVRQAQLLDPHCDMLLVGDSLGMAVHGLPNTVGVTLEMMILHGRAVARGIDMFDCVMPTRNARTGHYFTRSGTVRGLPSAPVTAMSSGSPRRWSGVAPSTVERISSLAATTSSDDVRMEPGAMPLTRMRSCATSWASERMNMPMPPLDAA